MRPIAAKALLLFALVPAWNLSGAPGAAVARDDLGRRAKLTILVDKVMQPTARWVTEEWMVEAAADAGFNVFSPRRGHDRLGEVVEVTQWCGKYGIYHMPWMRGTLAAPMEAVADGKRVVWANGVEQPLWSPNSDEFWDWTRSYIVEYAKISATEPHLMGVFLDYENYARGKQGNLYSLSYDDGIMARFAQARGIELPALELAGRKKWLDEQGLHDAFAEFQIAHWRERCRSLRQAVDRHNPKFQFCIYPAPGTLFMVQAAYPEWATQTAPLILADASTYGRPSRFLPQAASLKVNRDRLLKHVEVPKQAGIPFLYAGGIDPVVKGADPEFCGKNAVMISEATDGYWIFYEGPKYDKDHPEYWRWFTWANRHIAQGNFKAQHEPRENEEGWAIALLKGQGRRARLAPPASTHEQVAFDTVKLRRENVILVAGTAGQPVEVRLRNEPVAHYQFPLAWELRGLDMKKVLAGQIAYRQTGCIRFTPERDGVYLLAASAGGCAYSVVSANTPVGLFTGDSLRLIYDAKRLYFRVPAGVKRFAVTARGWGGETVRLNVFDSAGKLAATGQTLLENAKTILDVPVAGPGGGTWALEVAKADEGVLEDVRIQLDAKLPPVLSLTPEHVFEIDRPK